MNNEDKDNRPTASIIVPVYNVADYLTKCLDSIAAQTYRRWEAVLVDDGSTDGSGEICDGYAKSDPRFIVVHQANAGVSQARNVGLDHVLGQWVAFVDADDWLDPAYLEQLLDRTTDSVDLVAGGWISAAGPAVPPERLVSRSDFSSEIMHSAINHGNVWGKLFRHEVFSINGLRFARNVRWAEDVMMINEYLVYARTAALAAVSGYHYTDRPGSAIKRLHPVEAEHAGFLAAKRVRELLEDAFPGQKLSFSPEAYLMRLIQAVIIDNTMRDDRSARLRFLRSLDFKPGWVKVRRGPVREMLFSMLVRMRRWGLLDRLMH